MPLRACHDGHSGNPPSALHLFALYTRGTEVQVQTFGLNSVIASIDRVSVASGRPEPDADLISTETLPGSSLKVAPPTALMPPDDRDDLARTVWQNLGIHLARTVWQTRRASREVC